MLGSYVILLLVSWKRYQQVESLLLDSTVTMAMATTTLQLDRKLFSYRESASLEALFTGKARESLDDR